MQHLTEEQLVLLHYRDLDDPAALQHLGSCEICCSGLDSIRGVLAIVDGAAIPERGAEYGEQVWNVLRWKLGSRSRRVIRWLAPLAAAAILVLVFLAGGWWNAWNTTTAPIATTAQNSTMWFPRPAARPATAPAVEPIHNAITTPEAAPQTSLAAVTAEPKRDEPRVASSRATHESRIAAVRNETSTGESPRVKERILLLVLGDHFNSSERMLVELANANPKEELDISAEQKRSEELLASNRLYRQTANQNGDRRVASVLDDLEPLLMQIVNSPSRLSPAELGELQKRIEAKGILFKVRVIGSQVDRTDAPAPMKQSNTL